ncbi:MAG: F0F1 ATP synthase subunit B [Patescibacteria group bacterium]
MDDLIKTFSIDWKLIIAQLVNFTIVILVLGVYALKPLTKLMAEREEKIKKSLKDAEAIDSKMKEIADEREGEIVKGRKEAQKLIVLAEKESEEIRAQRLEKTQKEVEKVIDTAKNQIRNEREVMIRDVKDELGGLVSLALNKLAHSTIDEKTHKKLIDKTIAELKDTDINQ